MFYIRLFGSIIWAAALIFICYQLEDGTQLAKWDLEKISWLDIIGLFGFIGFIQGSSMLRFYFDMLRNESNTRYYNVYKDSYGREVKREEDGDAKLSGCFFTLVFGFLLSFFLSAVLSPILFVVNIGTLLWGLFSETRFRWLLVILLPALVLGVGYGSYRAYCIIDKRIEMMEEQRQKEIQANTPVYVPQSASSPAGYVSPSGVRPAPVTQPAVAQPASLQNTHRPFVRPVNTPADVPCTRCNGTGVKITRTRCRACRGSGVKQQRIRGVRERIQTICNACNGNKYVEDQRKCVRCRGRGRARR